MYLEVPEADLEVQESSSWYLELQVASQRCWRQAISIWRCSGCLEVHEVNSVYLEASETDLEV